MGAAGGRDPARGAGVGSGDQTLQDVFFLSTFSQLALGEVLENSWSTPMAAAPMGLGGQVGMRRDPAAWGEGMGEWESSWEARSSAGFLSCT